MFILKEKQDVAASFQNLIIIDKKNLLIGVRTII